MCVPATAGFGILLALLTVAADSPAPQRTIFLTGEVAWPGLAGTSIEGNSRDDVITLEGAVPTATIGPVKVRGAYRVLYVKRGATVGRFEAHGIDAQVTDACIRAHADVVVIRNTHCVMTGGPQTGGVNMPFGLDIIAAKTVSVEDSSFDGFQWRTSADRYWNGDGITIERDVPSAQFRRVTANSNSDAGFDVRPYALMSDVAAADNCRNFRFWSGGDVGTLTSGDSIKRGGTSACSAIWLNGSLSEPRPRLHIRKLIVRMRRPGIIIQVETGPANIDIEQCDIKAPAGSTMIQFERGAGEVSLGAGCTLRQQV
jgi:hypothetical protein